EPGVVLEVVVPDQTEHGDPLVAAGPEVLRDRRPLGKQDLLWPELLMARDQGPLLAEPRADLVDRLRLDEGVEHVWRVAGQLHAGPEPDPLLEEVSRDERPQDEERAAILEVSGLVYGLELVAADESDPQLVAVVLGAEDEPLTVGPPRGARDG